MNSALILSSDYERGAEQQMQRWRERMLRESGLLNVAAARVQSKINSYIPEKVHGAVTTVIKQMTQAVLAGSGLIAPTPLVDATLAMRERIALEKIKTYRTTATVEGGITGAGGILLGLADFPMLLGIKLKLLFDLAAVYGHSCNEFSERLYLLQIFQLAFSSQRHRRKIFLEIENWERRTQPAALDQFDWRAYQQEYRNYIDLAKLAQLVPVIGAPVGAIVNHRLIEQLGATAMNAYRMRWFATNGVKPQRNAVV